MKSKKLNKGTFVFFDWVDSCSSNGWRNVDYLEHDRSPLGYIESLGIVVESTEKYLSISTSASLYKTVSESYMDILTIPWSAIEFLKVVNIKLPKKRF